jgi:hypothetical protein
MAPIAEFSLLQVDFKKFNLVDVNFMSFLGIFDSV